MDYNKLIFKKSIATFYNKIILLIIAISLTSLFTINYSIQDSFAADDITNKTHTLSELFKNVEKSVVQISSEDESTELLGSRLGFWICL